jgi:hypothetical protein
VAGLVLGALALSFLAVWVLRAYPNSGDEYAYVLQARMLLEGRLWNPLPPAPDFFKCAQTLYIGGKWLTRYPPGWPLILAAGHLAGLPFWAVCPLVGAALLLAVAKLCEAEGGRRCAIIGLALIAPTPFFLYNAASYFNHVSTALFVVLFCYWGVRFLDTGNWRSALWAGMALGAAGLDRPINAVLAGIPFGVALLLRPQAGRLFKSLAVGLGGLPFLAAYLLSNSAASGHPLVPVTYLYAPKQHLGYPAANEIGEIVPMANELRMAAARLIALPVATSPLLGLAYPAALAWAGYMRRLRFYDWIFPVTVVGFLFYAELGGNQYGPRYYFEAFPPLVVTASLALVEQRSWPRVAKAAPLALAAHVMIALAVFGGLAPQLRGRIDANMDIYDQVRRQRIENAVVLVRVEQNSPDYLRNGLRFDGPVIYALDLPGRVGELETLYPGRRFYVYERGMDESQGRLIPLAPRARD